LPAACEPLCCRLDQFACKTAYLATNPACADAAEDGNGVATHCEPSRTRAPSLTTDRPSLILTICTSSIGRTSPQPILLFAGPSKVAGTYLCGHAIGEHKRVCVVVGQEQDPRALLRCTHQPVIEHAGRQQYQRTRRFFKWACADRRQAPLRQWGNHPNQVRVEVLTTGPAVFGVGAAYQGSLPSDLGRQTVAARNREYRCRCVVFVCRLSCRLLCQKTSTGCLLTYFIRTYVHTYAYMIGLFLSCVGWPANRWFV